LGNDQEAMRRAAAHDLPEKALRRLIDQLERTVTGLRRPSDSSVWSDYELDCHYDAHATAAKEQFVEAILEGWEPDTVWDVGCNRGQYSVIAARHARRVVAMDADELAVGTLVRRAGVSGDRILPLVMDLTNPSPSQGWAGAERSGLTARGPADAILALALVHHLSIAGHIPLLSVVDWLADHGRRAIVEFVPLSDPMAQRLLATRREMPRDYDRRTFEDALASRFQVRATGQLPNSPRTLYALERR
jgi:protein-L-isoaspartate O-methyltransferase